MQKSDNHEINLLKTQCSALEEQVKLLIKTESELRRTQAELIHSKEKIEDYNKTLEQKVEERTHELLQINEKLRSEMAEREKAEDEKRKLVDCLKRAEKMEAVGILAGSVAHDLNNILNGVIGYPEIILQNIPKDSPLIPWITAIRDCGERAAAVVQDLLILARRGVVVQDVVNINTIVQKVLSSPEFGKMSKDCPHFQMNLDLDCALLNVRGSSIHIYSSLTNIFLNALEAMGQGGNLSITTLNVIVTIPKDGFERIPPGEYIAIKISDTGVGISKNDLNKIFEPFFTKKKMGKSGTGLGLAIVWGTIKDHRGYIDVESQEGKGTTFTLYFPATRDPVAVERTPSNPEDYRGNNESILIIDDVKIQRDICTQFLTQLGYRVKSVPSGEDALCYLENRKVDLLVLDIVMNPGINGLETYKRILRLHPDQKAVIASGFTETKLVKEAQQLGAGPFLKKPYTLEQIGSVIKNMLQSTN
jgi:two-component system cell cycle sensor histidine kinase/response regulator CckA